MEKFNQFAVVLALSTLILSCDQKPEENNSEAISIPQQVTHTSIKNTLQNLPKSIPPKPDIQERLSHELSFPETLELASLLFRRNN